MVSVRRKTSLNAKKNINNYFQHLQDRKREHIIKNVKKKCSKSTMSPFTNSYKTTNIIAMQCWRGGCGFYLRLRVAQKPAVNSGTHQSTLNSRTTEGEERKLVYKSEKEHRWREKELYVKGMCGERAGSPWSAGKLVIGMFRADLLCYTRGPPGSRRSVPPRTHTPQARTWHDVS